MPFVIVPMAVLVVVVIAFLMHMPVCRHIFILHIVHTAHGALSRLITAAAIAVHWADIGRSVLRALLVRISFHMISIVHVPVFVSVLGLIGSRLVAGCIGIATAGDDKKGQCQNRQESDKKLVVCHDH